MRLAFVPLSLLFAFTGCRSTIKVEYMYPAEFTLPQEVRTVAIVDRVGRGESDEAIEGLEDALRGSPRVTVANPAAAAAALAQAKVAVGAPLDATSAAAMCKAAGATGIVSLDSYSFAGDWRYAETTETRTKTVSEKPANCDNCEPVVKEVTEEVPIVIATFYGSGDTQWVVTDCAGKQLTTDAVSAGGAIEGKGDRNVEARDDAGDTSGLEAEVAHAAGAGFSTHISPRAVSADRAYFKTGSKEIKAGAKAAKSGNWERAQKQWKAALDSDKDKVKGKAQLNLAVSYEREDKLDEAIKHARKASRLLEGEKGTADYLDALIERKALEQKVGEQLPAPAVPAAPAPQ